MEPQAEDADGSMVFRVSEAEVLNADRGPDPIAEQVVDALREGLGERLVGVALYGSRARGDAHPASDWDFLAVAEGLPEGTLARHIFLKRILPSSCRAQASLLVVTPAEFEGRDASLYLDIALDGEILFDPRSRLRQRLGALKRMIRERGLLRERTPDGDVWRQQEPSEVSLGARYGLFRCRTRPITGRA